MKKFEKNIIKQEYGGLELPVEKLSSINPANRSHGDGAEFIRSMRTITALREGCSNAAPMKTEHASYFWFYPNSSTHYL